MAARRAVTLYTVLVTFVLHFPPSASEEFSFISNEVAALSELPLDRLVQLKKLLEHSNENEERVEEAETRTIDDRPFNYVPPLALASKRSGYEEEYELKKTDHQSKVNTVFTLSVTTLAFLAFGGYLLCLIVQAIKYKTTYYNMNGQQPTTVFLSSAGIKKKPAFSQYGRRKRHAMLDNLAGDEMYDSLINFCKGYAKWNSSINHRQVAS